MYFLSVGQTSGGMSGVSVPSTREKPAQWKHLPLHCSVHGTCIVASTLVAEELNKVEKRKQEGMSVSPYQITPSHCPQLG